MLQEKKQEHRDWDWDWDWQKEKEGKIYIFAKAWRIKNGIDWTLHITVFNQPSLFEVNWIYATLYTSIDERQCVGSL